MAVIESRLALLRSPMTDQELVEGLRAGGAKEMDCLRQIVSEQESNVVQYIRFRGGEEADARTIFRDGLVILRQHIKEGTFPEDVRLRTYLFAICKFLWLYRFGDQLKPDFQDTKPGVDLSGDPLLEWMEHGNDGHVGDQAAELTALRKELSELELEVDEAKKPKANPRRRWAVIGIFALLLFVGGYTFWEAKYPSGGTLFNDFYQPYPLPALGEPGGHWHQAAHFYANGNYAGALSQLDSVAAAEASYLADFYRGVCLSAGDQGDPLEAIPYFDRVLQESNDMHEAALWYRSLAQLRAGNKAEALEGLNKLNETGPYRKAQVEKLIGILG